MEDGENVALTIQPLARYRVLMVRVLKRYIGKFRLFGFLGKV